VFVELEKPGEISEWAKERRTALTAIRGLPPEYARNVGQVQFRFPAMGKALGTKDRADPYVVALGLTMTSDRQPWIVVTTETMKKRPMRKIPGVCDALGVKCISLDELIELELGNAEGEAGE
jgi:hypothetical protein